jgi:hypothetical protein
MVAVGAELTAGGVASDLEDHAGQGQLEEARPLVTRLDVSRGVDSAGGRAVARNPTRTGGGSCRSRPDRRPVRRRAGAHGHSTAANRGFGRQPMDPSPQGIGAVDVFLPLTASTPPSYQARIRIRTEDELPGTPPNGPLEQRASGPTPRGRCDPLFSLCENAIAKEPGLSYLERWRCVS